MNDVPSKNMAELRPLEFISDKTSAIRNVGQRLKQ